MTSLKRQLKLVPEIIPISLDAIDYGGFCEQRNHEIEERDQSPTSISSFVYLYALVKWGCK